MSRKLLILKTESPHLIGKNLFQVKLLRSRRDICSVTKKPSISIIKRTIYWIKVPQRHLIQFCKHVHCTWSPRIRSKSSCFEANSICSSSMVRCLDSMLICPRSEAESIIESSASVFLTCSKCLICSVSAVTSSSHPEN